MDRLEVLLSSGIYGLWVKWDKLVFLRRQTHNESEEEPKDTRRAEKVGGLSFKNSGSSWLFFAQLGGWTGASVLAVIEFTMEQSF